MLPFYTDWPESTEQMQQEFDEAGFTCLYHGCDLTREDDCVRLVELIELEFGCLHTLVNNIERGGMPVIHGPYGLLVNQDQWQREFDTTLKAKWNLFNHTLPLLKQSAGGAVLNLSSIAGVVGRSGPAAMLFSDGYSSANRAVSSFTETWAREAAPEVRVNEIMLGLIDSRHGEGTRGWSELDSTQRQALLDHTLLDRTGSVEEVAEAVYFLACKAPYVTGAVLRIDGGYLLGADPAGPIPPGILEP